MNTHYKGLIYILVFCSVISSTCESSYQLDIPDYGSKIVINGFLSTDQSISVQIFESRFIYDSISYLKPLKKPLKNPTVQLWLNDEYVNDLYCKYEKSFFPIKIDSVSYSTLLKPIPEGLYTIKVKAEGFAEAVASIKMPKPVSIARVDTMLMADRITKQYSIHFKDSNQGSEYYFIKIFIPRLVLDMNCDTSMILFERNFVTEFTYNENFLFSDKQFNGKEAAVSLLIPSVVYDQILKLHDHYACSEINIDKIYTRKMYIWLYTCSEEFYRYYKSYRTILERGDDIFYEPVKVFSNIKNGYGILAGYSAYCDSSMVVKIRTVTR